MTVLEIASFMHKLKIAQKWESDLDDLVQFDVYVFWIMFGMAFEVGLMFCLMCEAWFCIFQVCGVYGARVKMEIGWLNGDFEGWCSPIGFGCSNSFSAPFMICLHCGLRYLGAGSRNLMFWCLGQNSAKWKWFLGKDDDLAQVATSKYHLGIVWSQAGSMNLGFHKILVWKVVLRLGLHLLILTVPKVAMHHSKHVWFSVGGLLVLLL